MVFATVVSNIIIFVIFVRALTLDGAGDGILFFIKPDFSRLADSRVNTTIQLLYRRMIPHFKRMSPNDVQYKPIRMEVFK